MPDFITQNAVGDIKDVKVLSNSSQMKIQREAAVQANKDHVIVTGTHTHVSGPVQVPPQKIIRRNDLGPKK